MLGMVIQAVIPTFGSLRQKDGEAKASLGYVDRALSKKTVKQPTINKVTGKERSGFKGNTEIS